MGMEVPKGYRGKIDAANARRARNLASPDVKAQRQALLNAKYAEDSRGPVHEHDLTPPRQFVEVAVHNPETDAGGFDPNSMESDAPVVSEAVVEETAADPVADEAPKRRKNAKE